MSTSLWSHLGPSSLQLCSMCLFMALNPRSHFAGPQPWPGHGFSAVHKELDVLLCTAALRHLGYSGVIQTWTLHGEGNPASVSWAFLAPKSPQPCGASGCLVSCCHLLPVNLPWLTFPCFIPCMHIMPLDCRKIDWSVVSENLTTLPKSQATQWLDLLGGLWRYFRRFPNVAFFLNSLSIIKEKQPDFFERLCEWSFFAITAEKLIWISKPFRAQSSRGIFSPWILLLLSFFSDFSNFNFSAL